MKFGIFDQNDYTDTSYPQQYEERLALGSLYEEMGFHCYHMSEHHGTPLSTTPSPSVFLAAMAQRTRTLLLGPLVYLLPAYNPLRLAEEVAMLDVLSQGRFQLGVGRGASSHEMAYLGIAPDDMQPMYVEALSIICEGLRSGVVDHKGKFWSYEQVQLSILPIQRPFPPIWMAISSPESSVWAARNKVNVVVAAPAERARAVFQTYLEESARTSADDGNTPFLGLNRYVVVAETDDEAMAIAARAWRVFYASFFKLWRRYGGVPGIRLPEDLSALHASGSAVIGSPKTVREALARQMEISGANYFSGTFVFGDMSDQEVRRSITLFGMQVMPSLAETGRHAHARLREAA